MNTRTATVLLEGLHDPHDHAVWEEFDTRFRPVLHGFARRLGVADADAADVAQETLTRFVQAYRAGRYSRERGRLSSWLIGIASNCIADLHRTRGRRREQARVSRIDEADPARMSQIWEDECHRTLLDEALGALRTETRIDPRTLRAFERIVLHEEPAAEVAREMDMTVNAVYIAKNRCLSRLRAIVADLSESLDSPMESDE